MEQIVEIKNISELHIGDRICPKNHKQVMYVVGLYASADQLQPEDNTGTIYCDFEDNPGDVFEYCVNEIEKIVE